MTHFRDIIIIIIKQQGTDCVYESLLLFGTKSCGEDDCHITI